MREIRKAVRGMQRAMRKELMPAMDEVTLSMQAFLRAVGGEVEFKWEVDTRVRSAEPRPRPPRKAL